MKKPDCPWVSVSFLPERQSSSQLLDSIFRLVTNPKEGPVTIKCSSFPEETELKTNDCLYGSDHIIQSSAIVQIGCKLAALRGKDSLAFLENERYNISEEPSQIATIWMTGVPFQGSPREPERDGGRIGDYVYNLLKTACLANDPRLASICVEDRLADPEDFMDNPWSTPFFNFYLSRSWGDQIVQRVVDKMGGAFTEEIANGIYFSTYKWFNPNRLSLDHGAREKAAVEASRLLARQFRAMSRESNTNAER